MDFAGQGQDPQAGQSAGNANWGNFVGNVSDNQGGSAQTGQFGGFVTPIQPQPGQVQHVQPQTVQPQAVQPQTTNQQMTQSAQFTPMTDTTIPAPQPQTIRTPTPAPSVRDVSQQEIDANDDFDDMPVTGNTSGYIFGSVWGDFATVIKMPPHTFNFDENKFLRLLAGSISLTKDEKWKIIQFIPKLSQTKIEQLMSILEEEQRKFQELAAEHGDHLKKLEEKHMMEWKDLEYKYEQKTRRNNDASKADEIRKNLGI